jgi:hypothetical protein
MDIKRIKFERTGGFAGMRLAADFELDDLPDEQAHTLAELLDDMDFNKLPKRLGDTTSMADGFTYEITVETKKWEHTVTISEESSIPDKVESLLELLNRIAREQARKR